jgi:CHASE2 domain-containing sensor protein
MTDLRSRSDALSELDPAARIRVRIGSLIAALAAAIAVASPIFLPPVLGLFDPDEGRPTLGLSLSQPLFDLFQRNSPGDIESNVIVVTLDERSLARYGGWPWSRFDMAGLVKAIAAQRPAAIGFDLLFPEPDRLTPQTFEEYYPELSARGRAEIEALEVSDGMFGRTIGSTPSVLARLGVPDNGSASLLPPPARFTGPVPRALRNYPQAITNIPVIDGAAQGIGLVNSEPDRDGVVRSIPLVARVGGRLTPSLALEIVRIAEGEPPIRLEGDGQRLQMVRIGKHSILTTPDGRMRLRYRRISTDQLVSPIDIADGKVAPNLFTGKIVLVGLTSAGTIDVVNTPRAAQTFGVYVQAQAIDAILHSRPLARPSWAIFGEWISGLVLVLVAIAFLPRLRLTMIGVLAVGLLLGAIGGSWAAFQTGLLLDPAPVVAPSVVAALTMISLLFVEGGRVRTRLRSILDQERHEREAASKIQMGMLIPRENLRKVTQAVEIDAVLLPARTVGGDLYDVFMLGEDRLCFVVGDVTGKGLPASLFMALAKALSRSLLMQPGMTVGAALGAINAELSSENGQDMQLSVLAGVLHLADGRLELSAAGHEHPVIVDTAGKVRTLRLDGGPPLCAMDNFTYPVESDCLQPGETLLIFTDGVTEAQDPGHDLFGAERTLAAVERAAGPAPLNGLVDGLVAAVRAFEAGGESSDDLTVLALRRPAAA